MIPNSELYQFSGTFWHIYKKTNSWGWRKGRFRIRKDPLNYVEGRFFRSTLFYSWVVTTNRNWYDDYYCLQSGLEYLLKFNRSIDSDLHDPGILPATMLHNRWWRSDQNPIRNTVYLWQLFARILDKYCILNSYHVRLAMGPDRQRKLG